MLRIDRNYIENAIARYRSDFELRDNDRYVIYGAGGFGEKLLKRLLQDGCTCECFLDKKRNGSVFGYECVNINETDKVAALVARDDIIVLIALHNRDVDPYLVKVDLKEMGFARVYAPIDYYERLRGVLDDVYWLSDKDVYLNNVDSIDRAFQGIKNREVFLDVLDYRLGSGDLKYRKQYGQYLPEPLVSRIDYSCLVDAGAYDGDTITALMDAGIGITRYIAFEPDIDNYSILCRNVLGAGFEQCILPLGLGDHDEMLNFGRSGESAGFMSSGNEGVGPDSSALTVKLDDVLRNVRISFFKMDVEGFEIKALTGGVETIRKYVPALAVCIYHKPEHLWEIYIYLESVYPGVYDYYIFEHGHGSFELVLYAVPKQKCFTE
jgi:FkbM family methyltransferase